MQVTEATKRFSHKKLKSLREQHGLSVTQMAAHLGVVENTYRSMERGRAMPRVNHVLIMLELFELRPTDLSQLLE